MKNDKKLRISIGQSRFAKNWNEQELKWSDLINKLKTPIRTPEKIEEFLNFNKSKQDELKDVGGFVAGRLKDGRRKAENIIDRSIVTLDADNIDAGKTNEILERVDNLGCAYAIYSTRKHTSYKPRLRILIPLCEPVTVDEYEPIARKISSFIGMNIMDNSTFEASRLMYWPSCSSNSEYIFTYADKNFADGKGILNLYKNWRDVEEWPKIESAEVIIKKEIQKQKNPLDKVGIVGAFCRIYDIDSAIHNFLSDIYETGTYKDKYTFIGGSVANGAHVYENGNFLYSYHATDPASRQLCNSFDLVRIHKFKELDDEAKDKTPVTQLPSFKAMCDFALQQEEVKNLLVKEKIISSAKDDFTDNFTDEFTDKDDMNWTTKLKVSKDGNLLKTAENIKIILDNDPNLKDKFIFDRFTGRFLVVDKVPWYYLKSFKKYSWSDTDEACLRNYIEKVYNITAPNKIRDALSELKMQKSIHVVQDYIEKLKWDGIPRVETLLIDYLGAEDSEYVRAVMVKSMVAAVARSFKEDGVKFDTMPILLGPQGLGKSTFLRKLGREWFTDSITSLEGKDTVIAMQRCLIVEIAELAAFGKVENNRLKQMLSSECDLFREPYEREAREHPRHCVFWGTTNDSEFLKDTTGNRRFWPVVTGANKAKKSVFTELDNEIDQIWAESYELYRKGEKLYLEGKAEEQAKNYQEQCREHSPKEGIIKEYLDKKVPADWYKKTLEERRSFNMFEADNEKEELVSKDKICAAEIWCECFNGDLKYMKRADVKEINDILNRMEGWKRIETSARFGPSYGLQRGYKRH